MSALIGEKRNHVGSKEHKGPGGRRSRLLILIKKNSPGCPELLFKAYIFFLCAWAKKGGTAGIRCDQLLL